MSGWTEETLFAYFQTLVNERDRRYEQRFTAQEQALDKSAKAIALASEKAEVAIERRFESVNEFRAQLADQTVNFMHIDVYEVQHRELVSRVELIEKWRTTITARASVMIGVGVLAGGSLGAFIGRVVK